MINSEASDYIQELHRYIWKFIRIIYPEAEGTIDAHIDSALEEAKWRLVGNDVMMKKFAIEKEAMRKKFTDDKEIKHMELMKKWLEVYAGERNAED